MRVASVLLVLNHQSSIAAYALGNAAQAYYHLSCSTAKSHENYQQVSSEIVKANALMIIFIQITLIILISSIVR